MKKLIPLILLIGAMQLSAMNDEAPYAGTNYPANGPSAIGQQVSRRNFASTQQEIQGGRKSTKKSHTNKPDSELHDLLHEQILSHAAFAADRGATKEDLKDLLEVLSLRVTTKEDLEALATKGDLKALATKKDLKVLDGALTLSKMLNTKVAYLDSRPLTWQDRFKDPVFNSLGVLTACVLVYHYFISGCPL